MIKRARSPVTVQEWVAALPDTDSNDNDANEDDNSNDNDDNDLALGAEAGFTPPHQTLHHPSNNVAKLLLQRNNSHHHRTVEKHQQHQHPVRTLQHTDTAASFKSNISHLSTSR